MNAETVGRVMRRAAETERLTKLGRGRYGPARVPPGSVSEVSECPNEASGQQRLCADCYAVIREPSDDEPPGEPEEW